MIDFNQSDETTTRRSFTLRTPAPYAELYRMFYIAEGDYKHFHGLPPEASLSDDSLTVTVGDDEVIVFFDYPGTARKQLKQDH